jgi:hypothetical protein
VEGVDAILVNAILASPCLLNFLNVKEQERVRDAKAQTTINSWSTYLVLWRETASEGCGGSSKSAIVNIFKATVVVVEHRKVNFAARVGSKKKVHGS